MRYLIFCGHNYYPSGGWEDYIGATEHLDQALVLVADHMGDDRYDRWFHVVDITTGEIVLKCDNAEFPSYGDVLKFDPWLK